MFPGQLRAFYEAVRTGSVRKASEQLGLAPSSVSRQILILERQMGAPLFDRSASGVALTHAGKLVAEYARSVILDYDGLRADLNGMKGIRRGFVRIVSVEGAVCEAVSTIAAFQVQHPGVNFQLRVLPASKIAPSIKLGEADVGITFCYRPDVELRHEGQFSDPVVLVVSPEHPLAGASGVRVTDLAALRLAVPETAFNIRQALDQASQAAGYALEPAISTDSFTALKDFARLGTGAAVMARLSVRAEENLGMLKSIPIDAPELQQTSIDIITLKKRRVPAVVKAFIADLKQIIQGASVAHAASPEISPTYSKPAMQNYAAPLRAGAAATAAPSV